MSFHVLIVDDEQHIRRMIGKFVQDGYPEYRVSYASNGIEAYEIIAGEKPDIVITDIRIPGLDGIQLVEKCYNDHLQTRFVIISGYKRFEYAQQAIRFGVDDYLLKPVKKEDLLSIIQSIVLSIQEQQSRNEESSTMQKQLSQAQRQLREDAISRAITGQEQPHEELFPYSRFILLVMRYCFDAEFQENMSYQQVLHMNLSTLIEAQIDKKDPIGIDLLVFEDQAVILFNYQEENESLILKCVSSVASSIVRWAEQNSELHISIGIGRAFQDAGGLMKETKRACENAYAYFVYGYDRIFDDKDFWGKKRDLPESILSSIHNCRPLLEEGNHLKIKASVLEVFRMAASINSLHPKCLLDVVDEFCSLLNQYISTLKLDGELSEIRPVQSIRADSLQMFIERGTAFVMKNIERIEESKSQIQNIPVAQAKKYLEQHIGEDISLEMLAEKVNLSPSYFSTLFKNTTGKNYMEYVLTLRIEEAKRLLTETNMSVNDIAAAVGYLDVHSFSKRFKKDVGIIPTKYRKYHLDSDAKWW